MNVDIQRIVNAFDASLPIAKAWTPPSAWYTHPAFEALERRVTFPGHWQPVARASLLAAPGSFVSGCLAGEPWVVVRDGQDLRAFSNVCRHKGREVVTGGGVAEALSCAYHGWTYDLGGRLRKAPRMAGIEDFDREAMSLPRLGVDRWGPWVFVHGDVDAPRIRETHPEIDAAMCASGWEALVFHSEKSWEVDCNWKVFVDNYLDGGYHVPTMHPTLDAQIDMASYKTELFASSSLQSSSGASSRIGERALYAWLHPGFMINRYGPCMDVNFVVPLGPRRCRVDYEFYFAPDQHESAIAASIAQSDVTQREDIAVCESVQRGLASAHYDRGRYAPTVEQGEHHFHRLLAADYRLALRG